MRFLVIVGLALIVVGVFALGYQGFTYFSHDQVAQFGPVQITQDRAHTVWLPPIVGITSLVVGGLLVLLGRKQSPSEL
jgi:hypothetical protein